MAERTLSVRRYATVVTTPPDTYFPNGPLSTDLIVPLGTLEAVELVIPAGHAGATGFSLWLAGAQIWPFDEAANWIIGDGDRIDDDLGIEVDTQLVAVTYNQGFYEHSHYVRLKIRDIPRVVAATSSGPLDLAALNPEA